MPMPSRRQPAEAGAIELREDERQHELRSFGRRRGRKLSARQQHLLDEVLPRVSLPMSEPAPQSLASVFSSPVSKVWLEIGFGGGEHLLWQAAANRDTGLIGCEVFEDGVVKALSGVETAELQNVKVCAEDARAVLRWLPAGSIDKAFILFPDPWPKKRHVKRRLINRALLDELARVMSPGAELRIATDIGDYLRTILEAFAGYSGFAWQAQCPADWRERGADWPGTRYEAKAVREGRRRYFLRFKRA